MRSWSDSICVKIKTVILFLLQQKLKELWPNVSVQDQVIISAVTYFLHKYLIGGYLKAKPKNAFHLSLLAHSSTAKLLLHWQWAHCKRPPSLIFLKRVSNDPGRELHSLQHWTAHNGPECDQIFNRIKLLSINYRDVGMSPHERNSGFQGNGT